MNMLIDLRMEGRVAIVFGGGTQGERKAKNLLRNGARVLVVSRSFSESLKELGRLGELELLEGDIEEDFNALSPRISGADLVFAATDSRQVNTEIASHARELGILVCAVDIPTISDFYSPAVAQKGSIRVGVCTDGKSPLMSRLLRQRIEKIITEEDVLQVELQAHAQERKMRAVISTNGTLITKDVARRLKDSGISYVGISIDGSDAETHDAIRNQQGSFEKAIQALKNCVEIDLKCGIRITASKDNVAEIPKLLDMCLELGVPRFCLYWLVPSGRGEGIYAEKQLSREEILETLDFLYEKAKTLDPSVIEILTVDAPQDGIYLLKKMSKEGHPEYENAYKLLSFTGDSCSAGDRAANVDPVGNVFACQFAQREELVVGNVRERKFSDLWNDQENAILNRFRNKKEALKGACGTCVNKDICGGGCRIRALNQHGDIWAEDSMCPCDLLCTPLP